VALGFQEISEMHQAMAVEFCWVICQLYVTFKYSRTNTDVELSKIEDPAHPTDRGAAETLEFAHFKREIYQKVLCRIFLL
jgi:hypothetical protein